MIIKGYFDNDVDNVYAIETDEEDLKNGVTLSNLFDRVRLPFCEWDIEKDNKLEDGYKTTYRKEQIIMTDQEIMNDFDEDKYTKSYCERQKCNQCNGSDFNGEPNGYGCTGLENRINTMYNSILARRRQKLSL